MRIFKNRSNRGRELLVALAALVQSFADFLGLVRYNFPDGFRRLVFAMRTHNTVRPMD